MGALENNRIFSFKYTGWRVFWRVFTTFLGILACCAIVFGKSKKHESLFWFCYLEIVGGLGLQICVLLILDMILTKEIILYPEKISKKWRFGIRRDVFFATSRFGAMKTPFFSSKRFYPFWYSNVFTLILGVFYDEYLVETEDVRLMNKYLAEISGRDLHTFEKSSGSVSLKSFLKGENTHE